MNKTYDESTTLVVYILLQRRLEQKLGKLGASTSRTNLIIYHGVTNILGEAAELFHVFGTVQEPCDLASLFQWGKLLKNIIQFSSKSRALDWVPTLESV